MAKFGLSKSLLLIVIKRFSLNVSGLEEEIILLILFDNLVFFEENRSKKHPIFVCPILLFHNQSHAI